MPGLLLASVLAAGCGDDGPAGVTEPPPEDRVTDLAFVSGEDQVILGGRRSPEAFRVRATDATGRPVAGATVEFQVSGDGGGILSQPKSLTDSVGVAETFVLDALNGSATLTARTGKAEALASFLVERAPGEIRFEEASGAVGLPALPHPDSLVRVRVFDTEGEPMAGVEVWFAGPPELSRGRDSTDALGWASTVVRRSHLSAGSGPIFSFILGFPEVTAIAHRPVEGAAERVVLVSVDGLRGDALERWSPPVLSRLAREGAFSARARTVVPSLTTPAHLSLLSGVAPESHGVFNEQLQFTEKMARLEPLFRHADRQGLNARAFISRDGPLEGFETALRCKLAFGLDSLTLVSDGAGRIVDEARPVLTDPGIELVFLHIPEPDLAGHAHGFESPEYGRAVLAADSAVAGVVEGLGEETLLIVTSDHGGGGAFGSHQHGSDSDEDVLIPLLLWGSRVEAGSDPGEASILDVAPTALWALGFEPPDHYEGRILTNGFR